MKMMTRTLFAAFLSTFLASCGSAPATSDLMSGGGQLSLTGKIRVYQAGAYKGLQIDIRNAGTTLAVGPSATVNISGIGFNGNAQLYPYYGGNTSQAFTVFPGDDGYILVKFPVGADIRYGQLVTVDVQALGSSAFQLLSGAAVFCQKGVELGCD